VFRRWLLPDDLSPAAIEEYRALRATIRQRGSLRLIVTSLTFVTWSALLLAAARLSGPVLGLVPLVALAAGFEVVFAAHVGVERVGRYIQVHYEPAEGGPPAWERLALAIGPRANAGSGIDALFSGLFVAATLLNFAVTGLMSRGFWATLGWSAGLEIAACAVVHAVFIGRVLRARRFAATQRDRDLALFSETSGG
jgi:hypothetical protein